ncbi:unknown [[Mannheimia] succiniciproducens MBEL55E]|uniref:Uncharacterized protein n=1 Tax=Mannheimia succiniciproducens (strain KCTC 0769BP / MBEL55E) TaxID=221988 RepID=Q65QD6_MANSM|nr:unknown [[Mannheimia] succiniciproducens MBEL55E]
MVCYSPICSYNYINKCKAVLLAPLFFTPESKCTQKSAVKNFRNFYRTF